VLYENTFRAADLDADRAASQSIVLFLKGHGAIESKEMKRFGEKRKLLNVWTWVPEMQEYLQDYWEERDELPKCGHRIHIPPERDGDTFYCKFCGEAHDRETIKEVV